MGVTTGDIIALETMAAMRIVTGSHESVGDMGIGVEASQHGSPTAVCWRATSDVKEFGTLLPLGVANGLL